MMVIVGYAIIAVKSLVFPVGLESFLRIMHINYHMSTIAQYHCDKCGMEFPSIASLEVHNWTKHSS